ncbi:MAG: beta strand repeat-containing protein, partial [Armatimonadota bacterium]
NQAKDQADPTNKEPIIFTAVFSKEVEDFTAADVVVSGTAGGTKTVVVDPPTGPAAEYTIAIMGMTTTGTVIASVPANVVHDSAGNSNDASLSNDNVVLFDAEGPSVTINQAASQSDPTNQSTVRFTAVFSEAVTGFDATDVVVTVSPSVTPTVNVIPGGDQMTYTIVVGGLTTPQGGVLSCTVTAAIPAGICQDAAGNLNQASTSTDNQVTVDGGIPVVSICQASGQADPTNVSPIAFQVQFNEPVVGFTADDVIISGTAGGTITKTVRDDGGGNYTVFVSGMTCPPGSTLPGTVIARILADAATDLAGNPSLSSDSLPCDNQVSFDNLGPAVTVEQASDQPDSTWVNEARFKVTFAEPVSDFTAEDVALGGSVGFAGDPIVTVANQGGGNTVFEVTVKGFDYSRPGSVTVSVPAGVAHDSAGNGNLASTGVDNSVVFFPEQCSADTLKDIPDGDSDGVTSVLDLSGFSGKILSVGVVVDILHDYDADLKATLISPAGTRVLLFQGVGGGGQNFTATLIADEAPVSITAGSAPFSDSAGYRPMSPLSVLKNEDITGVWKLELVDMNVGSTGKLVSWCLRISIADTEPPSATITAPSGPTCVTPLEFAVKFSEPVVGLAADQFVVTNGTATGLSGTGADYSLEVEPAGDGKIDVTLPARTAHDTCGNYNANPAKASFTYDGPPRVSIDQATSQPDPTALAPVNFTVHFHDSTGAAKPVTGFGADGVIVTGTAFGPGAVPVVVVTGSGDTYNVAVSGMDRSGTVIATVPAGVATSANGCLNLASTSTDNTVDYDITPVTVTINVAPGQADPTTVQPISYVVQFSKPVSDFAAGDVVVTGTAGGTKTVSVTGSGTDYTVKVSGLTSSGYVEASIPAGVAHDALGNPNIASTSTKNRVWFDDLTNPKVTVVVAAGQPDPAKDEPVNFTVTFNKVVTGFGDDPGDVNVGGTAFGTGAVKSVEFEEQNGSWNVAVSGMTGPGTVTLSVPAGVACDPGGKCNDASNVAEVAFDNVRPTVTINQAAGQPDPTAASVINFTVEFSEPVSDFTDEDVTITGTAFGEGSTKTAVVTGGPAIYNVAVSGMNTTGTVFAAVPENAAFDAAGNGNEASTSTDNSVMYDMPPLVTIDQAAGQADPTNASPIRFTVVFSEPVVGFGPSSVQVSGTAFGSGSVKRVLVKGTGPTYTIEVSGMNQSGTVVAVIPAGVVQDYVGVYNLASTSTDNTVSFDITRPTVTVEKAAGQTDPTKDPVINFTAVFSKPVVDFTDAAVTVTGTAFGGGATKTVTVTGIGTTYNIAVSGMNATGTVVVSIGAGAVHDAVGNGNEASTSTDNVVDYDITGPSVTVNQAAGQSDPTNASPINFTVVFSEPVSDFTSEDVTIGGTAGATTAEVTGSGTTYNVAVSGMTSAGTVVVSVAESVAHDSVGNPNSASTSTDNTVAFDDTALTVTINQASAQADPTRDLPINFTVVFSKPVKDFTSADVTISGTAGGTKSVTVTGSGTTYNVAVTGMDATGTVVASIEAGKAHDSAGNPNEESTSADNSVTYDITPPTIAITRPTDQDSCVWNCDTFKIGGTADDGVSLAAVTWQTGAGEGGICTGTTTWSASGISISSGDTVTVTAMDAAGNTASDSIDVTVTPALPEQGDWTRLAMVSVPITPFDEDPKQVVGFYSDYWVSYDPNAANYLRYPDPRTWFTPVSSAPGRGFWAGFVGANTVTPAGMVPDQTQPATIHLLPGWNLIGQPFINPVPWTMNGIKVRIGSQEKTLAQARDAGWVRDYAWGWQPDASGGAYYLVCDPSVIPAAVGELKPWRAYWFKALVECDLVLPAP